jgi:hypothetical protein
MTAAAVGATAVGATMTHSTRNNDAFATHTPITESSCGCPDTLCGFPVFCGENFSQQVRTAGNDFVAFEEAVGFAEKAFEPAASFLTTDDGGVWATARPPSGAWVIVHCCLLVFVLKDAI